MNGKAFLLNEFQCFLLLQYIAEIITALLSSKQLFYARDVFARAGIYFDYFTDLDEKRHFYDCACA